MKKIMLEMPLVSQCSASDCSYNISSNCHARAITIGDSTHPGCDTFMDGAHHTKHADLTAGIGACKMGNCKFNDDLECMADTIRVGMRGSKANCMTYASR